MKRLNLPETKKALSVAFIVCASAAAVCAFLLTFTVSDYYIFNRMGEYGVIFCLSQWFKKAGLLLIMLAAFFKARSCGDAVKYFLPLFVILSCCLFGEFFDASPVVAEGDANGEIFRKINGFFPKWLNVTLFSLQNALYLACCALLFVRDGFKINCKSLLTIPAAVAMALPLNIFENFFDINAIPSDSFLRFYNFTIWHFIAIAVLAGSTVGLYYFLKNKPRELQHKYLAAVALCLLLQYHSKDSMLMGDGYNVYNTVFAALPLFICNIGVYIACASVIFKKKALYAMSFFIHAVGALTVFVYFGKNEMSNYGIFCSYSILYFCLTHCLLFALCVIPSALGHYTFKIKDCVIPLVYYFGVIIVASVASTLISSLSATWVADDGITHLVYDGVYVQGLDENGLGYLKPNYAFTQTNPLPFDVPNLIPMYGAFKYLNVFYVLLVYIAYVCLFFAFFGVYRAFLATRAKILVKIGEWRSGQALPAAEGLAGEVAASDEENSAEEPVEEPADEKPEENPAD